tara:strand:- start:4521 stop:5213 length:693 start_codon:yes stop_codon:yes gene_type:complete
MKYIGMKIAITGKMGSGKSYLADKISNKYGFYKASFAGRVKELASELFDMRGKDRGLLINFATKMREIDPEVWIRSMLKSIHDKKNVIVDDLRLKNEYDKLRKNGWYIIKIEIDEEKRKLQLNDKYGVYEACQHIAYSNSVTENDVVGLSDESFDLVIRTKEDYSIFDSMVSTYLKEKDKGVRDRNRDICFVSGRVQRGGRYDTDYDSNEDLVLGNEYDSNDKWAYRRRI